MTHSVEVQASGTTLINGEPGDFGAAVQRFAAEAASTGAAVLVEATDPTSGTALYLVDSSGRMTPAPANQGEGAPQAAKAAVAASMTPMAPIVSSVPQAAPGAPVTSAPAPAEAAAEVPQYRRRQPTAADFAASRSEAAQRPAEEGLQGALNAFLPASAKLAPGEKERARREARAGAQRGLAGARTVTVVNLKGGAAKTTITYLVAATLGRVRGGNILAWDNNENKGTLGDRSIRAGHDHTAIDVLEHIDRFRTPETAHEITNYVRRQGDSKFDVLASQNVASDRAVIDGEAFTQLHAVLRQFYHLMVVDTGNASTASTWQAAVELADGLVLTAMNKEDSLKTAMATIDVLVQAGYTNKLSKAVLLVTQPALAAQGRKAAVGAQAARLQRTREHAEAFGIQVLELPFDPSLDDGDDIEYEKLLPQTQEAYLKATAAIVGGL